MKAQINHLLLVLFIILCILLLIVGIGSTFYSKLNWIGSITPDELVDIVQNPNGSGRYMLITNQEANGIKQLKNLMVDSGYERNDILLVFRGEIGDRKNSLFIFRDNDLNVKFSETDNLVNAYAISWRRLNLPPGIAVRR